jgi:hypothetical protein
MAPATPSACDDEFNTGGPGLNAKWTTVNMGACDVNTTVPDCLYIHDIGTYWEACLQPIPTGDFTIFTKIAVAAYNSTTEYYGCGLMLADGTTYGTGKQFVGFLNWSGTAPNDAAAFAYTNFQSMGSGQDNYTAPCRYLRLRRYGSNYYYAYSQDGKTWAEMTIVPGFVPAYFGVAVHNSPSGSYYANFSFEFFRYVAQGSTPPLLGGYRTYVS